MVSRKDIRELNKWLHGHTDEGTTERMGLIEALDRLEELHKMEQDPNVTVDREAYVEAQEAAKDGIAGVVNVANDAVDRTSVFEDEDGNIIVDLPNRGLQRGQDGMPPHPGEGRGGRGGGGGNP